MEAEEKEEEADIRRWHTETGAPLITPFAPPLTCKVQVLQGGACGERLGQSQASLLPLLALQHVIVICHPRPTHVHTYTNI